MQCVCVFFFSCSVFSTISPPSPLFSYPLSGLIFNASACMRPSVDVPQLLQFRRPDLNNLASLTHSFIFLEKRLIGPAITRCLRLAQSTMSGGEVMEHKQGCWESSPSRRGTACREKKGYRLQGYSPQSCFILPFSQHVDICAHAYTHTLLLFFSFIEELSQPYVI